jgi:predicted AlkP superfamily pyrophosphatase or phosphodiesterase
MILGVGLLASFSGAQIQRPQPTGSQTKLHIQPHSIAHVLLLSIDGMHALDLARLTKERSDSALARLSAHGITYTNAHTSFPSNSWPGLLSMVTGGSPNSTGVIFENNYDRSLSPPASDCSKIGTVVIFDSSIDKNPNAVDGGGGIDLEKLPRDPKNGCKPVFPHNFIRVNNIFEVIKQAGGKTAWSDKHPAYEFLNGPSGTGVDDLYTPEVHANRVGKSIPKIEAYDDLKVDAILNQIHGQDHTGSRHIGVPAVFGMNFQAISVAQKLEGNGYLDANGTPSSGLLDAFTHTDQSISKMLAALQQHGLRASTLIIVTAKHGDVPIDPTRLKHADLEFIPKTVSAIDKNLLARLNQDGSIALVWLADQKRTAEVTAALRKIQTEAGIEEIYSGDSLKLRFNDPESDPRVPDIIIQPNAGQIYVNPGSGFIAEHGGMTDADRHVPLLISHPSLGRQEIKFPAQTAQIAPTILKALGLDPNSLQAVRQEKTPSLPGFDEAMHGSEH